MNLSQRLDEARRQREAGDAPEVMHTIRAARDAQIYDGTDLRTGDTITTEEWDERLRERHGDFHLFDRPDDARRKLHEQRANKKSWVLDLRGPEPVIELED